MKKFFLIMVCLACIVSAFFQNFGITSRYNILASDYFERLRTVIDNKPEGVKLTLNETFQTEDFVALMPEFPAWNNVDIDSLTDVPDALETFMNNVISYMRHFFVHLSEAFPKLWKNIRLALSFIASTIKDLVDFARDLWNYITDNETLEWFKAFGMALVPVDWEALDSDGVEHNFNLESFFKWTTRHMNPIPSAD